MRDGVRPERCRPLCLVRRRNVLRCSSTLLPQPEHPLTYHCHPTRRSVAKIRAQPEKRSISAPPTVNVGGGKLDFRIVGVAKVTLQLYYEKRLPSKPAEHHPLSGVSCHQTKERGRRLFSKLEYTSESCIHLLDDAAFCLFFRSADEIVVASPSALGTRSVWRQ